MTAKFGSTKLVNVPAAVASVAAITTIAVTAQSAVAQPATHTFIVDQGMKIRNNNSSQTCTVGFNSPSTHTSYTAAHCGEDGDRISLVDASANEYISPAVGTIHRSKHYFKDEKAGVISNDWAVIEWDPEVQLNGNRFSGNTVVPIESTHPGDEVCFHGQTTHGNSTKATCGPLIKVIKGNLIIGIQVEDHGDSGSPLWMPGKGLLGTLSGAFDFKDPDTNERTIVLNGMLTNDFDPLTGDELISVFNDTVNDHPEYLRSEHTIDAPLETTPFINKNDFSFTRNSLKPQATSTNTPAAPTSTKATTNIPAPTPAVVTTPTATPTSSPTSSPVTSSAVSTPTPTPTSSAVTSKATPTSTQATATPSPTSTKATTNVPAPTPAVVTTPTSAPTSSPVTSKAQPTPTSSPVTSKATPTSTQATPTSTQATATPSPTNTKATTNVPAPTPAVVTTPTSVKATPTPTPTSVKATPTPTPTSVKATPTPTASKAQPTPTVPPVDNKGLDTGAIIGIVVAVLAVLGIGAGFVLTGGGGILAGLKLF